MNFTKTLPSFLAMLTLVAAKVDETNGQSRHLQPIEENLKLFHQAAVISRAVYFEDKLNGKKLNCKKVKEDLGGGSTNCESFEAGLDAAAVIKHDGKCFAAFRGTRAPLSNTKKNRQSFYDDTMQNFDGDYAIEEDGCWVRENFSSVYENLRYSFLIPKLFECEQTCGGSGCPIVLTGHSKGGAAAVVASRELPKTGIFKDDSYVITFGAQAPFFKADKCEKAIDSSRHFRIVTAKEANDKLFCDPIPEHSKKKIILDNPWFEKTFMEGSKKNTVHLGNTVLVTKEGQIARSFGDVTCQHFEDDELHVLTDDDFLKYDSYGDTDGIPQPLHNIETYMDYLDDAKNGAIDGLNEGHRCTKSWQCHDDMICDYELNTCVHDPNYINDVTYEEGTWLVTATYEWPENVDDLVIRLLPRESIYPDSIYQCRTASIKGNVFQLIELSEAVQVAFGKGSCENFSLLSIQTVDFNPSRTTAAELHLLPTDAPSIQSIDGYEAHDTGGCDDRNELGTSSAYDIFQCAAKCDKKNNCVSFEYLKDGKTCRLSSSCSQLSLTVNDANSDNYWYRKEIEGYVAHDTGGCLGKNELGVFQFETLTQCVAKCNTMENCVSFEYKKEGTTCALSTTCDHLSQTVNTPNSSNYWYQRNFENYERHDTGGCAGKNELGIHYYETITECAAKCDSKDACVSFEYGKHGTRCALSSTCSHLYQTVNSNHDINYWYRRTDTPMI